MNQKSVTPAYDRSVSGGCSFGDLAILVSFWFGEGAILELHVPVLIWVHTAIAFLLLILLWLGHPGNTDWTIGCSVMVVFYPAYKYCRIVW